ncbi:caspase (peptidase) [Bradyrhizobium sp. CCBAU 45394]|uniref:caspase family protein n=1 Tax=Bradyrhizobium sp. CCBAU 45394 TaxID=1325087 RepID=UPI0023023C7C|nr:caspase family protein [Bradyrhizobium sp. CCBAU 45394]MDA9391451.1 caspase (peptidase) [Bradyrhizobium sp. CCBAU 45394]
MGALPWFSLFVSFWLVCGSAHAERRMALVIGNSAYKSVPRLSNPANDATLVGDMFKKAGFDWIDIRTDLNAAEMRKALRDFGGRARDAEVAVIYYAGHGIELDGANYLIPTDAALETDSDVLDETVALDRALFAVEPAKQLRLIILDACRDNPFAKSMKRTVAARAIGRGLAKVEPNSPNTMIAFAAKAGSTASDGDSRNSPFAAALVERLPTPGLDLRKAFGFVRDDVLKNTSYRQEPYVYGSLGGDDVPLVAAKPIATGPQASPDDAVRRNYELAMQLGTRDGWTAFLSRYADGFYADLAKGQLNKIAAEEARAAEVEKARQAEQKVAALPAPAPSPEPAQSPQELAKSVQSELRRVGCLADAESGDWNIKSQRSLTLFNKYAGTKLNTALASTDALDAIKARSGRVCPLVCDHGFRADGDACVKIACRAGYRVNDNNDCEKVQDKKPPIAVRDQSRVRDETAPSKQQSSGRMVCNQAGCRPLKSGCTLVSRGGAALREIEICD